MLRKLLVAVMALALLAMMADDLLAQGRGGRGGGAGAGARPGRGGAARNAQRNEREQNAAEQRLNRAFGEDEDDDRPLYRGADFDDNDVRNGVRKFIKDNDTDRDGKLSEHEFKGVETADIFGFLDRNRDGFLDESELPVYVREKMQTDVAKEILDKETAKLMKRHDKNKDGVVDAEEFRGRDEEFNDIDTDGDLKISEKEMRQHARDEFEAKNGRLPADAPRWENASGGRGTDGDGEGEGDEGASREDLRKRWEGMSEEERQKLRDQWGQRGQRGQRGGNGGNGGNGGSGGDDPGSGGGDDPTDGDDEPSSGG